MVSKRQQAVELLKVSTISDKDLAKALRVSKNYAQVVISSINRSKGKKFSQFSVIRSGEKDNYIRELVDRGSDENDLLDSGSDRGKKGLRQLDARRKLLQIALNTRQGQANRMRFAQNVLRQNLDLSIEAQKILQ